MTWLFKRRRVRRRLKKTRQERAHYELHKERARSIIHERIAYWKERLNVSPNRIAVKDQRSRWGSCSTKGNLNFNYRLALIPSELVDYVIVHELCHLREFNHSPNFWKLIEEMLPDYLLRKQALHTYAELLSRAHLTQPGTRVS